MSLTRGGSGATRSITRTAAARIRSTSSVASRWRSSSARSTAAVTRLLVNELTVFGAGGLSPNAQHFAGPLCIFGVVPLEQHAGQVDLVCLRRPIGQTERDAAQQDVDQWQLVGEPERAVYLNGTQRGRFQYLGCQDHAGADLGAGRVLVAVVDQPRGVQH